MNLNLVVLYAIYIVAFLLFFRSFTFKTIPGGKRNFVLLTLLFFIGILLGFTQSKELTSGNFNARIDFINALITLFFIVSPSIILNIRIRINEIKTFAYIALIYSLFVLINTIVSGKYDSIFFGNLFGATTINYSILSLFVYLGLYLYLNGKRVGLLLAIISYTTCLLALSKWLFILYLSLPLILILHIYNNKRSKNESFFSFSRIFSIILVFSALIIIIPRILDITLELKNFYSFKDYLSSRVFSGLYESSNNLTISELSQARVLDGSRFPIWTDLIQRTINKPYSGIGFGARALNLGVEDHSMFVFMLSRFGIIVFGTSLIFIYKMYKNLIKRLQYSTVQLHKLLVSLFLLNVILQISTGMQWRAMPYAFIFGIISGIILRTKTFFTSKNRI